MFFIFFLFFPQHMLRVSFSSGRDRVHRHCWIPPFRTPPGNSLLLLTPFSSVTLVYENNIQHWDRNSIALLVRQKLTIRQNNLGRYFAKILVRSRPIFLDRSRALKRSIWIVFFDRFCGLGLGGDWFFHCFTKVFIFVYKSFHMFSNFFQTILDVKHWNRRRILFQIIR